ncbi:hypothetical protein [Streptomyces violaceusniger]|uniref:Uncharacterized protein n=1 Tax=Streptomyces violaceusniger (strain Tu 4113) TaxID=653045 RepID=G2NZZ0_STRV4|nr:hypothetical protein [Streptomyces violaceusniger]AEM80226.1 hypothetical protein Strvi_0444 [Streptomyces violaceusniger Tu 4113]
MQHWWIKYNVHDPFQWVACDPDKGEYPDPIQRRQELFEFDSNVEPVTPLLGGEPMGYGPTRQEILEKLRRHVGHDAVVILSCRHVDDPDAPAAPEITDFTSGRG